MRRRLIPAIAAIGYLSVHVPLLLLVLWSFNASRSGARWDGFSFVWYQRLLERADLLIALRTSLVVGLSATLLATAFGTLAALALARGRLRRAAWLEGSLALSIVTPEVIAGISLLILFGAFGLPLGYLSLIVAHTAFALPFTILVVLARLRGMDETLEEAALTLGADELTTFRRVTVPLLMPGIVGAALLAFTLSFDDFVITFFTAGPGTSTLPLLVYGMVRRTVEPSVNALSAILVVVTTLLLLLAQKALGVTRGAPGGAALERHTNSP
ncbi:MAG: ABC transporter permease [Gemmatimonadota bacterium]